MGKYSVVSNIHIKKAGVFDMDKLYSFVYAWYDEQNYFYHENLYKQKGDEVELEIWGVKKISGYTEFELKVDFHLWGVQEVEVIKHGKKVKMTKARLDITINSTIITDYEGRWSKTKFLEAMNKFYENYIIKKTIKDEWGAEIYKETYDIHDKIKSILEQEASRNG